MDNLRPPIGRVDSTWNDRSREWRKQNHQPIFFVSAIGGFIALVYSLNRIAILLTPETPADTYPQSLNGVRVALASILTFGAITYGVVNATRTLRLTLTMHRAERFGEAAQLLDDHTKVASQAAGIVSLGQLMHDDPHYSKNVETILTIYLKSLSSHPGLQHDEAKAVQSKHVRRLALSALGSVPKGSRRRRGLDLSEVCLGELNAVRRLNLEGADLTGACFYRTKIFDSNFTDAKLDGADIRSAEFLDCNVSGETSWSNLVKDADSKFWDSTLEKTHSRSDVAGADEAEAG